MYLSQLILDPRSRAVRWDLANCQALHRTVMRAFPQAAGRDEPGGDARAHFGVLYRLDIHPRSGVPLLLIQSGVQPDWTPLADGYLLDTGLENPQIKSLTAVHRALHAGQTLRFRLRANPAKKIDTKSSPDGQRRNGRRVELRDEAAQLAWLDRKGASAGFWLSSVRASRDVPNVRATTEDRVAGWRPRNHRPDDAGRLTFGAVLFDGTLQITDADLFRSALEQGIGPGKAYGFGLLSVGPVAR